MSKVIFYGDHPLSPTANAFFNRTLINSIQDKHEVACLTFNNINQEFIFNNKEKYNSIPIGMDFMKDSFGMQELAERLKETPFDILISNNDIWRLHNVWQQYSEIFRLTGFTWIQHFPCDANGPRQDWFQILQKVDIPLVYSKHGYNLYKTMVPKLQYLKPTVESGFEPYNKNKRTQSREIIFGKERNSEFIIGIVGKNQIRKDIIRGIEIFEKFVEKHPDSRLYLHMDAIDNMWGSDLLKVVNEKKLNQWVTFKTPGLHFSKENICQLYNAIDVLLVPSVAEGLCLPILEAQLCKTPVVGADNSAITELVDEDKGFLIKKSNDGIQIPIMAYGQRILDPRPRCDVDDAVEKLDYIYSNRGKIEEVINKGFANAKSYLEPTKFDKIFNYALGSIERRRVAKPGRKEKVLFIQYQSAGDVLITTGLLKGIKEQNKMELDYMVGPQYKDIITNNPEISEILDWDFDVVNQYSKWYNPHKLILTGNWNAQDLTLYEIYARLCNVPYGKMFIDCVEPGKEITDILLGTRYITLSNSGGHPFRFFPFFHEVIQGVKNVPFVQIGGPGDTPISGAFNLCGKLTFRESAWVVKNALLHAGVDTFQSHLAAALGKLQITLYGTGPKRVIRPRGFSIDIEPDYIQVCPILGPCGANRSECDARCIRSLSPSLIANCMTILLEEIEKGVEQDVTIENVRKRCSTEL